jgi:sRNA-binding carbon storage regulator CsrA
MRVLREELYEAVRKENLNALAADPSQIQALPKGPKLPSKDLKPNSTS